MYLFSLSTVQEGTIHSFHTITHRVIFKSGEKNGFVYTLKQ
jgi:hypothetical protein